MFLKFEQNNDGIDYCVGDCHGEFLRLSAMLKAISFDESKDRLFSVGDLCDRGPNSDQVLNWLEQPWFHPVAGNHEQLLIDAFSQFFYDQKIITENRPQTMSYPFTETSEIS